MIEFFKMLAEKAIENKMKNPVMQLGKDVMGGNVSQGLQNFAQNAYGPQMQFGQTMMDPNATGEQRLDAAFGVMAPRNQAQPQTVAPMVQPNQQGTSALLNTQDLPYGQGLPQYGLLPFMSRMG
jgi:hypothetical protein